MNYSINSRYPSLERLDSYPEYGDRRFKNQQNVVTPLVANRHRAYERKITNTDKLKAGIGAIAGTVIPMIFMMKKQKIKKKATKKRKRNNEEKINCHCHKIYHGLNCPRYRYMAFVIFYWWGRNNIHQYG